MDIELLMDVLEEIYEDNQTATAEDDINDLFGEFSTPTMTSYIPVPRPSAPFYRMLWNKMVECFDKNSECYKKAEISRQAFSLYVHQDPEKNKLPNKEQTLKLAIVLMLSLEEAEEFLSLAGYAFNPSNLLDVIVKEHISKGIYDRFEINDTLDHEGLPLLFFNGRRKYNKKKINTED